jgi:hypothetical protein
MRIHDGLPPALASTSVDAESLDVKKAGYARRVYQTKSSIAPTHFCETHTHCALQERRESSVASSFAELSSGNHGWIKRTRSPCLLDILPTLCSPALHPFRAAISTTQHNNNKESRLLPHSLHRTARSTIYLACCSILLGRPTQRSAFDRSSQLDPSRQARHELTSLGRSPYQLASPARPGLAFKASTRLLLPEPHISQPQSNHTPAVYIAITSCLPQPTLVWPCSSSPL